MATNSDGSIGPALPSSNVRIGANGQISYAAASTPTYQTTGTTTITQVSAAVSNSAAGQPLTVAGTMVVYSGIWANDASAAKGGVPVGALYKRSDGVIAFRQS